MCSKYVDREYQRYLDCMEHILAVLLNDNFMFVAGSRPECTDITQSDYHRSFLQSVLSSFFSDTALMRMLYHIRVMEEGESFDNYVNCRAERVQETQDNPEH